VAAALGAPLDALLVRKLGVPGHQELAFGALASGGVRVLNAEIVRAAGLSDEDIDAVVAQEAAELDRRERLYRGDRPPLAVAGRTVVVVDDGLATGATMRAGVATLRAAGAAHIVATAPVGTYEACDRLERVADVVRCPLRPEPFIAVGRWYADFREVPDAVVAELLAQGASPAPLTGR
jgi:predicted phosphoribosyltransferase